MQPSEYADWKTDPTTKGIFKTLKEAREKVKEMLARGATLMGNDGSTAEETGKAVGIIKGIDMILDLKSGDWEEETEPPDFGN